MVRGFGAKGENESSQAHMSDANKKIRETWEDSQEKSFSNIEIPRKKLARVLQFNFSLY